jgi:hypothetical protein
MIDHFLFFYNCMHMWCFLFFTWYRMCMLDSIGSCLYIIFILLVIFLFLRRSFLCVLQVNGLPGKAPLHAEDMNTYFLCLARRWGQERWRFVVRCILTPSLIIVCIFGCCPCNAIVGAEKVATNVASQLFCSVMCLGKCWWACPIFPRHAIFWYQ